MEIHFWAKGEEKVPRAGHTRDVSARGMFISTKSPYPPGTRFILKTLGSSVQFKAEAEVVHYFGTLHGSGTDADKEATDFVAAAREVDREGWANTISPFLHRLEPTGMGVRFLVPIPAIREILGLEDSP